MKYGFLPTSSLEDELSLNRSSMVPVLFIDAEPVVIIGRYRSLLSPMSDQDVFDFPLCSGHVTLDPMLSFPASIITLTDTGAAG